MRKLSFAFIILLLLPLFATHVSAAPSFKDVSRTNSHYTGITTLANEGVINGYPNGKYQPYQAIRRSQAAVLFKKQLGLAVPANKDEILKKYEDIRPSHAYGDAIAATTKAGIFKGSNGKFYDNALTREQMATVIVHAYDLKDTGKAVNANLSNVSPSHRHNVKILVQHGITNQTKNFRPYESVTRGQFATFMYRAINQAAQGDTTEVDKMSLDEKIGQLIFAGADGTKITDATTNIIEKYHVGGIILFGDNVDNAQQTVNFINAMKKKNKTNPSPLLFGVDEEGGRVTRMPDEVTSLPESGSIGALNDPDLSYQAGTVLGQQVQELGFNLDFAPVLDVNSNPNNPVIGDRSLSENPNIVSRLGIQTMKGIQDKGTISVVKHFPGHGDTDVDSHLQLPKVDKSYQELAGLELIPFQDAMIEGADVTMIAHILLPQIDADYPASMSQGVITDLLRGRLGFNGVVITDDLTMQAITDHYDIAEAAVQSVKAGGDMMLVAHNDAEVANVFKALKSAVKNGDIPGERIDESVQRIIKLKEKYRLSDDPAPKPDVSDINKKAKKILQAVS